jgi:hypothetical protein
VRSKVADLDNELTGLARAYLNVGAATGALNTWNHMPLDDVIIDRDKCYNNTTQKYLVPVDGVYFVSVKVGLWQLDSNWLVSLMAGVAKNDQITTCGARNPFIGQDGALDATCTDILPCAKGDNLSAMYYCNSGGLWFASGAGGGGGNYLTIYRVG